MVGASLAVWGFSPAANRAYTAIADNPPHCLPLTSGPSPLGSGPGASSQLWVSGSRRAYKNAFPFSIACSTWAGVAPTGVAPTGVAPTGVAPRADGAFAG